MWVSSGYFFPVFLAAGFFAAAFFATGFFAAAFFFAGILPSYNSLLADGRSIFRTERIA